MHLLKQIVIDSQDASEINEELETLFESVSGDYPMLQRLRAMTANMVLQEPRQQVYEHMKRVEVKDRRSHFKSVGDTSEEEQEVRT